LQATFGGLLRKGGFGGAAKGLGIAGAIPGAISQLKGVFGVFKGIGDFFSDIFGGASKTLLEIEQERQKEIEQTTRLLKASRTPPRPIFTKERSRAFVS